MQTLEFDVSIPLGGKAHRFGVVFAQMHESFKEPDGRVTEKTFRKLLGFDLTEKQIETFLSAVRESKHVDKVIWDQQEWSI